MIGIPYEELSERYKGLRYTDPNVISVIDLLSDVRESIKFADSGHEKQRLHNLLNEVIDLLHSAERSYDHELSANVKPFSGQSGSFSTVSFSVDIPQITVRCMDTPQLRVIGMQAYDNMDYYHGLFFIHEPAQDVSYHMGTTAFPLDIMFLELDGFNGDYSTIYTIGKIASNVHPGTVDLFSHRHVSAVLETLGGFAETFDIRPGDGVLVSNSKYYKEFFYNGI